MTRIITERSTGRQAQKTTLTWHLIGMAVWAMFAGFIAGCVMLTESDLTQLFTWFWGA